MAKPTFDTKWASNNVPTDNIEPPPILKDSGIPDGSTLAREYTNYQFMAGAAWDDWVRSYAMDNSLNLSDLADKTVSRANLGANNAANLTTGIIPTARLPDTSLTATGAVTGTVTLPKSGNASIALSASPTLTLSGDATGSATFSNLANATLSVTVADNSHSHDSTTLASASVTQKGVVQLNTSTGSTSTTLAATSSAVKSANDNANTKLTKSSNLGDLTSVSSARGNLGLRYGTLSINGNTTATVNIGASIVTAMAQQNTLDDYDSGGIGVTWSGSTLSLRNSYGNSLTIVYWVWV